MVTRLARAASIVEQRVFRPIAAVRDAWPEVMRARRKLPPIALTQTRTPRLTRVTRTILMTACGARTTFAVFAVGAGAPVVYSWVVSGAPRSTVVVSRPAVTRVGTPFTSTRARHG